MVLDTLSIFYRVAELKSFSGAGKALGFSQSTISRNISQLENELNTKLFDRNNKIVVLTTNGEILLKSVRKIFKEIEETKQSFQLLNTEPKGSLNVTTASGWISTLLLNNIVDFYNEYPDMRLRIVSSDFNPDLSFSKPEVAILSEIPTRTDLVQKYLMSFNLKLYASKEYIQMHGMPEKPKDLDNHKLITFGDSELLFSSPMSWHLRLGRKNAPPRQSILSANSAYMLYTVAQKGLGIVTLAKENHLVTNNSFVEVLPEINGPTIKAYYIYAKHLKHYSSIRGLENYLRKIIKKNNWS